MALDWAHYWELHTARMDIRGDKDRVIRLAAELVRSIAAVLPYPPRIVDLGCGEGHVLDRVRSLSGIRAHWIGVDTSVQALAQARSLYPTLELHHGDYTLDEALDGSCPVELVLAVNTLHEVFSCCRDERTGNICPNRGVARVKAALERIRGLLVAGGYLLVMDGIDTAPERLVTFGLVGPQANRLFETFVGSYQAFPIDYRRIGAHAIEMDGKSFMRFITKLVFVESGAWEIERSESYQFFTEPEMNAAIRDAGLEMVWSFKFSPSMDFWKSHVRPVGCDFTWPVERYVCLARKPART